jgi:hypothetical protein
MSFKQCTCVCLLANFLLALSEVGSDNRTNAIAIGRDRWRRKIMKMRTVVIHLITVLGLTVSGFAASHYICPGASGGTHSGAEWTDAYLGIGSGAGQINPGSMVRGDTYYVANGQITSASTQTTFGVADSGTSAITIIKAIDGANGTNTGWTNGGTGTCNSSQAGWGPILFTTDYWVFNGVTRSTATGNPWVDWRNHSSYGFYVNNNNGSNSPVANNTGAITGGVAGSSAPVNNITVKYFEVNGSHNGGSGCNINGTPVDFDDGVHISGGQSYNDYIGYYYIHDVGNASTILVDGLGTGVGAGTTIEYGWNQNTCYTHSSHSEMFNFRSWNNSKANGLIVRYNYLENNMGTAYIATPCGCSDIQPGNWDIYGNVFFYNAAESYSGSLGAGDGAILLFNFNNFEGFFHFYNNTISAIDQPGGACDVEISGNSGATMGTVAIYNNVFYHCLQINVGPPPCPSGGCTSFTYDYQSYFGMTTSADTSAHKQVSATDPFTNVGQSSNQDDFSLALDSSTWTSLSSPYNIDMVGVKRTSSRGVYQFGSSAPPSPPQNLAEVVH